MFLEVPGTVFWQFFPEAYVSASMDQIQNQDFCFPGAYLTLVLSDINGPQY